MVARLRRRDEFSRRAAESATGRARPPGSGDRPRSRASFSRRRLPRLGWVPRLMVLAVVPESNNPPAAVGTRAREGVRGELLPAVRTPPGVNLGWVRLRATASRACGPHQADVTHVAPSRNRSQVNPGARARWTRLRRRRPSLTRCGPERRSLWGARPGPHLNLPPAATATSVQHPIARRFVPHTNAASRALSVPLCIRCRASRAAIRAHCGPGSLRASAPVRTGVEEPVCVPRGAVRVIAVNNPIHEEVRLARLVEESGYPGYLIVHAASTRRAVALVGNPIVPRQARAVSKRRPLLRRAQQGQPATMTRGWPVNPQG